MDHCGARHPAKHNGQRGDIEEDRQVSLVEDCPDNDHETKNYAQYCREIHNAPDATVFPLFV
jgi:hypothetical protein